MSLKLIRRLNLRLVFVLIITSQVVSLNVYDPDGKKAEDRSLSSNNIGAALSNYSDSFFLIKMLLIFWLHFAFQTIGWFLGSVVWTALRPEAMISSDPDLSGGLNDGLLSGDFAATNLGMAGGQWIFFFLVWMGFLFANSSSGQARSGEAREVSVEDRQLGSSEIMRALDDLFTPSTVTKQSVVNILGALGGTVMLMLLGFTASSTSVQTVQIAKKKSFDPYDNFWRSASSDQSNWIENVDNIQF